MGSISNEAREVVTDSCASCWYKNIKDYFIEGSRLYILVENDKENAQLLQVYDLNTGKKLNRIRLK